MAIASALATQFAQSAILLTRHCHYPPRAHVKKYITAVHPIANELCPSTQRGERNLTASMGLAPLATESREDECCPLAGASHRRTRFCALFARLCALRTIRSHDSSVRSSRGIDEKMSPSFPRTVTSRIAVRAFFSQRLHRL